MFHRKGTDEGESEDGRDSKEPARAILGEVSGATLRVGVKGAVAGKDGLHGIRCVMISALQRIVRCCLFGKCADDESESSDGRLCLMGMMPPYIITITPSSTAPSMQRTSISTNLIIHPYLHHAISK